MPYWRRHFSTGYINPADGMLGVTSSQTSLIVSILSAGTTIGKFRKVKYSFRAEIPHGYCVERVLTNVLPNAGALASAPIADGIGRRFAMIVNTFVFTFGVILQIVSSKHHLTIPWEKQDNF